MSATRVPLDGDGWRCKPYLGEEWRFRRAFAADSSDVHSWIPATVPGSVLADAVAAGEVPDPRVDRNSRHCEWAAERSWVYRRSVSVPGELRGRRAVLHFEGLDYAADVYWNGTYVGSHEGMFAPAEFEVTDLMTRGPVQTLGVVLAPAPDSEPQVGRTQRVRTAKSRMTYGWDFCPRIIHQGVWDSVWLEIVDGIRITNLHVRTVLAPDHRRADITWQATIEADHAGVVAVEGSLCHPDGRVDVADTQQASVAPGMASLHGSFGIDAPALWWPNGSGDQALYELDLHAVLRRHDAGQATSEDRRAVRVGIRTVEMQANTDAPADARPYTLVVNGTRVYIQGWNWVPMDIHHGVEDPARLTHLIEMASRAGVNLLRVWGGGLIEREAFYDLCDEHGIMVWQEFPLSSSGISSVPSDDPAYVALMTAQAERIVPRRRNHASLVLWCGGNELDNSDGTPLDGDEPVIAALRAVVRRLDPDRAWLPTSPTGPRSNLSLAAVDEDPDGLHDVHGPWEHQGLEGQRTLYDRSTSLLHSEFGVEGMANLTTIEAFLSPEHRWPADRSNPVWVHRGDWWINTPLVQESFGGRIDDLPTLVRASQMLQAEGLRYAVESNRRRQWRNSGSIPWQFNESFPNGFCTSAVDYCGRPKAAYHAVAAAYRRLQASARFPTLAWQGRAAFEAELWLSNRDAGTRAVRLEASLVTPDGRRHHESSHACDAPAAGSAHVASLRCTLEPIDDEVFLLDLRVVDAGGGGDPMTAMSTRYVFSRTSDLGPLMRLPTTRLRVDQIATGQDGGVFSIANVGTSAALFVTVGDGRTAREPGYTWFGDSHFTLLPGEDRRVDAGWHGVPPGDMPPGDMPSGDMPSGDAAGSAARRVAVSAWNAPEVVVAAH